MKKKLFSLVLCMALLSSFTVSASAAFDDTDSSNLFTLTKYTASLFQNASFRNSTYNNWCYMLGDALTDIYNVNSGLVQRVIEIQSKIDFSNQHLGTISSSLGTIDSHIGSAADLNHSDFTNLLQTFATSSSSSTSQSGNDRYRLFTADGSKYFYSWDVVVTHFMLALTNDKVSVLGDRPLYSRIKQLQEVLASDDDLKLKQDNKANEDVATDAFVNGSSSKTSLGTGDIGNLKDVGGTFNDLTSLNGQSSISSFLSGLTSADGSGQGILMSKSAWRMFLSQCFAHQLETMDTRKAKRYVVHADGDSSTVYIGARSSDRYFRIYNKSLEDPQYQLLDPLSGDPLVVPEDSYIVRYEVELKRRVRTIKGVDMTLDLKPYFESYFADGKLLCDELRKIWLSFGNDIVLPAGFGEAEIVTDIQNYNISVAGGYRTPIHFQKFQKFSQK